MPRRISILSQQLPSYAIRLVFTLAFLVLDYATLEIELLPVENAQEVAQSVTFGEQRVVEHRSRHVLEIVRAIIVRRAVQVRSPNLFHSTDVCIVEILAAAEHQVLEQVRKPSFAGLFILGANVVPGVYGNDRRLMVLMYKHRQTVIEDESGVGNVGNRDARVRLCGFRLGRGSGFRFLLREKGDEHESPAEHGKDHRRKLVSHVDLQKILTFFLDGSRIILSRVRLEHTRSVAWFRKKHDAHADSHSASAAH